MYVIFIYIYIEMICMNMCLSFFGNRGPVSGIHLGLQPLIRGELQCVVDIELERGHAGRGHPSQGILLLLSHPDWVLEPVPSGWRSLTHGVQE